MPPAPETDAARGFGVLLLVLGALLVALAAVFDARVVASFHPRGAPTPEALYELGLSRVVLAAGGFALLVLGLLERQASWPLRRRWPVRLALAATLVVVPLAVLERVLAPFVEHPTVLFRRDEATGWRLVPNARDHWLGVPVRVNAQGMRGPERDRPKPPGTRRVLFLGDSVAFGAFVADDAATLPAQAEAGLRAATGLRVEGVNSAVGGWSPWQQLAFLRAEGADWEPDLVVLVFVLNDVTEKLELRRYGGDGEGFQLARTLPAGWRRVWERTALHHFGRALWARYVLGPDPQAEARRREAIGLRELVLEPERAGVKGAWQLTLNSVRDILAWCRERDAPLLIAMVPWLPQLEGDGLDAPQRVLAEWCALRDVPFLDLRPALVEAARAAGAPVGDLFVPGDAVHPNELGHAALGAAIAARVLELGLLSEE